MTIHVTGLSVGPWPMNCYVVADETSRAAWVIDPGAEVERIQAVLAEGGWQLAAIVQTHGHRDHTAGTAGLRAATGVPVLAHADDAPLFAAENLREYGGEPFVPDGWLRDGETIALGATEFAVIHTPGHTPGHITLVGGGACLSGDVVFRSGCGRTDLPGGDMRALERSLTRLLALPGDTTIYPGHGPAATVGYVRRCNPYVPELRTEDRG
jgi:glyoxylase-like metal-dependent hydrolase (beta-lactamase superfamily II)